MPELRKDPVIGRWVIISTERAKRPQYSTTRKESLPGAPCPFCPGNEEMTPPEILAYRPDGSQNDRPGWTLRVVPNKYPALVNEEEPDRRRDGLYDSMAGLGAHEVIIETPEHEVNMGMLGQTKFQEILWAYRERILDLGKEERFRYILIFKNQGAEAGATLEHTHSQLIALPIVPRDVLEEIMGAKEHYQDKGHCIYCDIVRQEIEVRSRTVSENENFLVVCPFAPRFPFETWILPKEHSPFFEQAPKRQILDLGRVLRESLIRLNRALDNPPFNYIIHSNPLHDEDNGHYHWHVEIMPKLTQVAGFEWGSGFYINPVPPEEAAQSLREIAL